MASRNAQLAEAVKAALNAPSAQAGFILPFTAKRIPAPVLDLTKLTALTVSVICDTADASEHTSRDTEEHNLKVLIGVEKKIAANPSSEAANVEIDPLMQLVEQVSDFFGPTTIDGSLGFFLGSQITALSSPMSMLTDKVFRGVVSVEFLLAL